MISFPNPYPVAHFPLPEGVLARAAGWSQNDCPYPPSPRAEAWLAGWHQEDAMLRDPEHLPGQAATL